MNLNNISLPYPVLGISDDILPLLDSNCIKAEVSSDLRFYHFEITLSFKNQDIENLIRRGKAEYSCEYECSKTMLRKCLKSEEPIFSFTIARTHVNGRINFNCFVSVKEPIISYVNKGFNQDYEGFKFNLGPGDILVAFPPIHYDADIKYDQLQAAGSFMQIRQSDLHKDVFFDITGDKIEILMPTPLYNLYNNPLVKGQAEIIHSSLVLNALTYSLLNIEDHQQTTWAKTIYYRLDTESDFSRSDLEEPSKIPLLAQRLLKNPYERLFNHLIITLSTTQNEE